MGPQDSKQLLAKRRILVGELEGEGKEKIPEVAPVLEIARTEKARSQLPVRERLGDSRLSSSGQTVEPEHMFVLFVIQPAFKLGKDISPGPLHASPSVTAEVSRVGDMRHPLETGEGRALLLFRSLHIEG